MRLNYKRLGDYIEPCNEKNEGNVIKTLQGISNRKYFQKTKTNTIGVDLSKYRVVRTGQFAFNRATTRNGDKISIALRYGKDCIVSPSYRIFKSKDENILNSEYLMMWFKRPDFDRYARFKSHGSAHEFFDWDEMQEVELPIPSIEKQREIVAEYNTIVNRIKLNETLNQKLEDTAQALYKHWFVDFEFPINLCHLEHVTSSAVEKREVSIESLNNIDHSKGYKSSGGEMVYNEELDMEIPLGWDSGVLGDLSSQFSGFSFKGDKYSFEKGISVVRGENVTEQKLRWNNHKKWNFELEERMKKCFLKENDIVIGMDGSKVGKNWSLISKYELPLLLAQRVTSVRGIKENQSLYIYYSMLVKDFQNYVSQVQTGTSIPHISGSQISGFPMLIPNDSILEMFHNYSEKIVKKSYLNTELSKKLEKFKDLLLSKMSKVETQAAEV